MTDEPFNPDDPFDASAEDFRLMIVLNAIGFLELHSKFKELPPARQVEMVIAAGSTALMCIVAAMVTKETHTHLAQIVGDYLPHALAQAIDIMENGETDAHH